MIHAPRIRIALAALLAAALLLAVAALAGAAPPGKGKKSGRTASASQYEYGPAGKQYGKTKVTICHKGKKTIRVGQPAVRAHLRHGDTLGSC